MVKRKGRKMSETTLEQKLSNISALIADLEKQLADAKKTRNDTAKEMISNGVSKSKVARLACISRQALYKIIEP